MDKPIIDAYAFVAASFFFSFAIVVLYGLLSEARKEK